MVLWQQHLVFDNNDSVAKIESWPNIKRMAYGHGVLNEESGGLLVADHLEVQYHIYGYKDLFDTEDKPISKIRWYNTGN